MKRRAGRRSSAPALLVVVVVACCGRRSLAHSLTLIGFDSAFCCSVVDLTDTTASATACTSPCPRRTRSPARCCCRPSPERSGRSSGCSASPTTCCAPCWATSLWPWTTRLQAAAGTTTAKPSCCPASSWDMRVIMC